jgi:hypothetical protein
MDTVGLTRERYNSNLIITIITVIKNCQYNGKQSPEDGSRVNSQNIMYIKYISENGCPK